MDSFITIRLYDAFYKSIEKIKNMAESVFVLREKVFWLIFFSSDPSLTLIFRRVQKILFFKTQNLQKISKKLKIDVDFFNAAQ